MSAARVLLVACVALSVACVGRSGTPPQPFDLLIVDALVFDGSRAPPRRTNIGLRDGRIVSVGAAADAATRERLDAAGLVLVPGFIDPHTHALNDLLDPARRANLNYLHQGVTTVVVGNDGRGVPERRQAFATLRRQGIGTHVGFFAGHGAIRRAVMGLSDRPPSRDELARMSEQVDTAMRDGALGLSSGLFYAPGSYAARDELIVLAAVAARHGGIYDTHLRDEGGASFGLLAAVDEAIDIGRAAGIPIHIAHIKALGADNWGRSAQVIERVNAARAGGLRVSADQYPWEASGTRLSNALIPRWAMTGSREALHARLRDPVLWPRLEGDMAAALRRRGGADALLVTAPQSPHRGRTLAQMATALETDPLRAAVHAVLDGDPNVASFVMSRDDILAFAREPWVMTGSDGSRGHPRKYGSYPKAWQSFVIEAAIMSPADFVHRSSGQVADTLGLCDRGYVRLGRRADLALIDLSRYRATASYERPTELADGVEHVLIGGRFVLRNAQPTGLLAGEVVGRNARACGGS